MKKIYLEQRVDTSILPMPGEGLPQMYVVKKITNSILFKVGHPLPPPEVDILCESDEWEVIIT